MKGKYLLVGIFIAVISWVGNYVYMDSHQLSEPIFLNHYYETHLQANTQLTFYYLTNKKDNADVRYVDINGIEGYPVSNGGFMMWDNGTPQYVQEFRHQYLKSVTIELPPNAVPVSKSIDAAWSFHNMTISFSDGKKIKANIGEVKIFPPISDQLALESKANGSSNQHREVSSLVASDNLTISDIIIPFTNFIADDISLKINVNQEELKQLNHDGNGEEMPEGFNEGLNGKWDQLPGTSIKDSKFPLSLKKDDRIQLFTKYNPKHNGYYQFDIKIVGKTASGEPFVYPVPVNDQPELSQKDIDTIIAVKQGGSSK